MKGTLRSLAPALLALLPALAAAAAQQDPEVSGVPVFPDAEARPEVARAVEAYYGAAGGGQGIVAAVYDTEQDFDRVADFYAPGTDEGKWGWRVKKRPLLHQLRTLEFYRAQRTTAESSAGSLEALEPLLGDADLSREEFAEEVRRLLERNREATVRIVEGSRRIKGDPDRSLLRIVVERPYVDLQRMELVDRTRILLLKIAGTPENHASGI
ncbi:MAG: hypothetical protein ABR599_06120 [Gemmatimonadota bacterium]